MNVAQPSIQKRLKYYDMLPVPGTYSQRKHINNHSMARCPLSILPIDLEVLPYLGPIPYMLPL